MNSLVIWESLFIPYIFPIGVRFIDDQSMHIKKKCSDMFVYGILVHWALTSSFKVCLLGIFVIVDACEIFIWVFTSWATLIMHLKCWGFMREFNEIMVDMYWVWEMSDLLLGSPNHCLIHHSIIGDMTFLYCTNMGWSLFIPLSHCLILYLITSF